jgi:hypothetical protein
MFGGVAQEDLHKATSEIHHINIHDIHRYKDMITEEGYRIYGAAAKYWEH